MSDKKEQSTQPNSKENKKQQKNPKKEQDSKDKKKPSVQVSDKKPDFVEYRLKKWAELKQKYEDSIKDRKGKAITITLPDNSTKDGKAFITTPLDIAQSISQGLANVAIAAKVNGVVWDLNRPLEESCKLEILKFDSPEAKEVFWHSSSHILGQALERVYSCLLCKGPPQKEGGYYYESYMGDKIVSENDYPTIKKVMDNIVKEKQPFERLVVSKEDALELFKYSKFKVEILSEKVKDGDYCTVYRCGDLIDPCKGPHLPHTGKVKAYTIVKNSSSYWRADATKESLQRVYGISFPDKKMLKEWEELQEQLKQRDHRIIGQKQELWIPHKLAPGMAFFLPHGQRIYLAMIDLLRKEYRKRGFMEVQTPNMLSTDLWKISGHYDHYKDNMFLLKVDDAEHGLKPMNCPAHCLIFDHRPRSYRELPLRLADFGILHRNELRGALTGMTRVRRFQQDDAHIFCREDQIEQEIAGCLDFMEHIYTIFGFTPKYNLSTRPEKYLGKIEVWEKAEAQLEQALKKFGKPYTIAKGDGAFYGPKIDVTIEDALKREHQCATIQLDFNLPERFNLSYNTQSSSDTEIRTSRPVMIHRAIYGSFERFMAIIAEHYAGKWPFWLSPRQIAVLPVSDKFLDYARQVKDMLHAEGYHVDLDDSNTNIKKKVKNAQLAQYNFMLVVGQKEQEHKTVNIRTRANEVQGEKKLEEALKFFATLRNEYK